ncbi:hypothetical protein ACFQ7M_12150 [Streptomyces massasporeus]
MYATSAHARGRWASRVYTNALIEHQAAALAGDPEALRAIRDARVVLGFAAPEVEQLERLDPGQRRMHAVRSIA